MQQVFQLEFKWGVSRGRDTYGYNICSLYVGGKKVSSCNGGGYDMKGTAFGDWIEKQFQSELKKLNPSDFYGMRVYDGEVVLDGACGFSSIERIVNALGYTIKFDRSTSKNRQLALMIKDNV